MLLFVIIPVILLVGSCGNLVSLYIFTRPRLNGLSTFRFLAYLSLVDLLYLLVGLPHIMVIIFFSGYDLRNYSNLACSVHSFLTYYLSHLSSNVLAAVGIFRCLTITRLRPPTKAAIKSRNARLRHQNASRNNKANNRSKQVSAMFNKSHENSECYSMAAECRLMTKTGNSPTHYSQSNGGVGGGAGTSCQNGSLHNVSSLSGSIKPVFRMRFGRADAFILAIMLIVFLFDSHFLLFMRLQPHYDDNNSNSSLVNNLTNFTTTNWSSEPEPVFRCYPTSSLQPDYFYFYVTIYPWIDLFLYSYIPFVIMMVCTILIIYRLLSINRRLSKSSSSNLNKKGSGGSSNDNSNNANRTTRSTQTDKKKGSTVTVSRNQTTDTNGIGGEDESIVERSVTDAGPPTSRTVVIHSPQLPPPPIILVNNHYYTEASSDSGPTLSNESERDTESSVKPPLPSASFPLQKYTKILVSMKQPTKQQQQVQTTMVESKKSDTTSSRSNDPIKKRARKNSQIYKLLLTLNVVFFVLVTPLVLCNSLGWLGSDDQDSSNKLIMELVYILAYLNHCINFLFYGLSCEMYRQSLLELLPSSSCLNK